MLVRSGAKLEAVTGDLDTVLHLVCDLTCPTKVDDSRVSIDALCAKKMAIAIRLLEDGFFSEEELRSAANHKNVRKENPIHILCASMADTTSRSLQVWLEAVPLVLVLMHCG